MPSSLTRVLSSALGYSPCVPVSVCGTDSLPSRPAAFLGSMESLSLAFHVVVRHSSPLGIDPPFVRHGPRGSTYGLEPVANIRLSYPSPSLLASTNTSWFRNINLISITYANWPRLRTRLTLGGRALPRKPYASGERVSHPLIRYSCRHLLF